MRTSNPALSASTFEQLRVFDESSTMTVSGAAMKTGVLLILAIAAAGISWTQTAAAVQGQALAPSGVWIWGGAIGGLILAIATIMKPAWSP